MNPDRESNRPSVVIFGTSELAEVLYAQIQSDNAMDIAGFTIDREYMNATTKFDLPVVHFEEVKDIWPPDQYYMLVALAYAELNNVRRRKYEQGLALGYRFTSFVHSSTTRFPGTTIGDNTIILDGNTLQPWSNIGSNVLIWSRNVIGHHCRIGNHCCITSGVLVGGRTTVGEHSFLGAGSVIRDNIQIGARVIVGAGCVVLNPAPDESVYKSINAERSRVPSSRLRRI